MHPRLVISPLTALLLAACTAQGEPQSKPEPADPPKAIAEPVAKPAISSLAGAPAVPKVKASTPVGECPAVATLPDDAPESQRKLVPMIEILRGLACQPVLFGESTPAILATLKAPEGLMLHVSRHGAAIDFDASTALPMPITVGDAVAAAGISHENLHFVRTKYYGWLLVDASGKPPAPWPPSELRIELVTTQEQPSLPGIVGIGGIAEGAKRDWDPEEQLGSLMIALPESALEFEHDEYASAAMLEALQVLALADDPNKVMSKALPSLGERYWMWEFGFGLDLGPEPVERTDTSIFPNRTELVASDLAEAMALPSPSHHVIREADTDYDQLASDGKSPFVWQGLSVEIGLQKRPGAHEGLAGWSVYVVRVERATPDK
jgi:hypothetical protein